MVAIAAWGSIGVTPRTICLPEFLNTSLAFVDSEWVIVVAFA